MSNTIYTQQIIDLAYDLWLDWNRQAYDVNNHMIRRGHKETDEGYWQRVGTYWKQGCNQNYTGKDTGMPWSGAFICYIMRRVGISVKQFKYNTLHSVYINKAIKSKLNQDTSYGFWGYNKI